MAKLPDLNVKIPNMQLDGIPVDCKIERLENARAFTMQLRLSVPDVERFSDNPDSALVAAAIQEAISTHGYRIRLSLISDKQAESEFTRMQPDGSIRELMPDEGTW